MIESIIRKQYLDKIKPFIGKQIIKVLTGGRRVGKTTILFQISDYIKDWDKKSNIIYIDKELHEFKSIKDSDDLYSFVNERVKKNRKNYIFIDEIQEIKDFEIALRQLFAESHDIYCTGSNARMLSGDLATYLTGRYIEFRISSLSYPEFLQFHKMPNDISSLLKYIRYGGLPYLINLELTDEIVYGYLRSIYNTIVLKDVVARYNIRDIDFLDRLTEYLSDNLGSYISSKKITDFLKSQRIKLSVNTVLNYLQYLCNAFFIEKVQRYDIQGKKKFEVNDKFYFSDLGLKHSIIPYKTNDIAKVLENLVYNHLVNQGYTVYIGKLQNMEIDFVAQKGDLTKYIQVSYLLSGPEAIEREFGNLLKIKDNFEKIVVSSDDLLYGNYKGIQHVRILDFLIQTDS
ncbi:MAG: ATP-binding protein [Chlorobi bacterium]|nr:ATP-binding protein [Chlorobiota bacterium]